MSHPGTAEESLVLVALVVAVVIAQTAHWLETHVYRDAVARGLAHPRRWSLAIAAFTLLGILPGILGYVAYVLARPAATDGRPA